jgi:hypothetical protein
VPQTCDVNKPRASCLLAFPQWRPRRRPELPTMTRRPRVQLLAKRRQDGLITNPTANYSVLRVQQAPNCRKQQTRPRFLRRQQRQQRLQTTPSHPEYDQALYYLSLPVCAANRTCTSFNGLHSTETSSTPTAEPTASTHRPPSQTTSANGF